MSNDRLLTASPALAELTGYTRAELTSPEFSLAHLFARGTPPVPVPPNDHEVATDEAVVVPLRGEPIACRRSVVRLPRKEPFLYALVLEPGAGALPGDANEVRVEVARGVVRACSSQLAAAILALRRTQIAIESVEHSHDEVLLHEMRRAGAIIEALEGVQGDVDALARAVGAVGRGGTGPT